MGQSAGVDNIPAELVQAGEGTMIDILTTICNKIWKTGEWPTTWTQLLVITLPKKGNLQLFQNYRTISLISRPSKVILKIILNRPQPQAEEIIAEEPAGFRAGRSTTEQIFSLGILGQKFLQHQQNLYHVFIDFTKAFDRVWHEALWATMRKYNINASIIRAIENLYDKAQSAVLFNGSVISNEGSKPEVLSRIAQTTAAFSRLKIIWRDKNISLASNVKLMRTLILSTFLYACESWTLTA